MPQTGKMCVILRNGKDGICVRLNIHSSAIETAGAGSSPFVLGNRARSLDSPDCWTYGARTLFDEWAESWGCALDAWRNRLVEAPTLLTRAHAFDDHRNCG
jgi:hypothetical protein